MKKCREFCKNIKFNVLQNIATSVENCVFVMKDAKFNCKNFCFIFTEKGHLLASVPIPLV